jgi:GNAT superfamily N-acetyltransferase
MYFRSLPNGIVIRSTSKEDVEQLEKLQIIVFPTLNDTHRLKAEHYLNHIQIFPDGQFVAVDGKLIIGMTTSIRLSDRFLHGSHTFDEIIGGGFCTGHDPSGEWLYGVDMGTHPDYRGRGLARALYIARHETVKKYALKGQYAVGMINGYGNFKTDLSPAEYYQKLLDGELKDPTVSAQIKIGFEANGLIENYLDDPQCGDCGVRLILAASKQIFDGATFYR